MFKVICFYVVLSYPVHAQEFSDFFKIVDIDSTSYQKNNMIIIEDVVSVVYYLVSEKSNVQVNGEFKDIQIGDSIKISMNKLQPPVVLKSTARSLQQYKYVIVYNKTYIIESDTVQVPVYSSSDIKDRFIRKKCMVVKNKSK
ncbi:MAG: hypothetical protein HYV28_13420 [Ignavibacteriales bacterium]|nr:hypothetical protein [Ignavibacteriales bacterium]